MPPSRHTNLQTVLGLCTLAGLGVGVVFYLAPLKTIPAEFHEVKDKLETVSATQMVQTEALKTLAEVASDTKQMRRDADANKAANERQDAEIENVKRRLDKLETYH